MWQLELYPPAISDVTRRIVINQKISRVEDIRSVLEVLERKLPGIFVE
jgi:hypothetical protein